MSSTDGTEAVPPIRIEYEDAVVGDEIHNSWGNRVLEHTTSKGEILALKVNTPRGLHRSEADMMQYAATNGILAPKVRGVYDIVTKRPIARVLVSERVPGDRLADVWRDLSATEQASIKDQLRTQIQKMRSLTQPFIGRLGRKPTRNIYDTVFTSYCGPFDDEEAFDNWCLRRFYGSSISRWRWQRELERKRRKAPSKFVLTHGDLSPRNIMVQGGVITGIVDWEHSGFFPEHVEYALAIGLGPGIEEWWRPVLKEVLEHCPKGMIKFTRRIEERVGSFIPDDS